MGEETKPNINFLLKKDLGISFHELSQWVSDPEFSARIDRISKSGITIGAEIVLSEMRETYKLYARRFFETEEAQPLDLKSARKTIRRIERHNGLTEWTENDWTEAIYPPDAMYPEGYEDMRYLDGLLSSLPEVCRRRICSSRRMLERIKSNGVAQNLEDIFQAIREDFYLMVKRCYNKSPKKYAIYYRERSVIAALCKAIYGDPDFWRSDIVEYWNSKKK